MWNSTIGKGHIRHYNLFMYTMLGDICRLLFEQPAENWRRPPGRPCSTWLRNMADDLKELDMDLLDVRASAQNRPLWRIIAKHGATLP